MFGVNPALCRLRYAANIETTDYRENPSEFLKSLPNSLQDPVIKLARAWKLDLEPESDCRAFVELLTKINIRSCGFDLEILEGLVRSECRCHFESDPDVVRTLIADYAINEKRLGSRIRRDELITYLGGKGIAARDPDLDSTADPAIYALQTQYLDSIRPYLIGGDLIRRSETKSLRELVAGERTDTSRLAVIHGRAGIGKSGVVYEFLEQLKELDIPFLPIRVDRKTPVIDAQHFGRQICNLSNSPARSLAKLAAGRRSVLIIDQLDALRWTSAHSEDAMDVLTEAIREALNPLLHMNMVVVLVCRSFDLEDDPRIRHLRDMVPSQSIEIGPLELDEVKSIVDADGQHWILLSNTQRRLLREPQSLYLWTQLQDTSGVATSFRTHTDLMRGYWEFVFEQGRCAGFNLDELRRITQTLVDYMDQSGSLTAPRSLISPPDAEVLQFLHSLNVLRTDETRRCMFSHQSHFDYLVAESVNRQLLAGTIRLHEWLCDSNQSLFRRGQLRQVLTLQRDDDSAEYIAAIEAIVESEQIRFHLKHLILRFLNQASPPSAAEVDLIVRLYGTSNWRSTIYEQVLWNSVPWFLALHERGCWHSWLESDDWQYVSGALQMLGPISRVAGDEVAQVISPFLDRSLEWSRRLANVLSWSQPSTDTARLFDIRIKLAQQGFGSTDHIWWDGLAKECPRRAVALIRLHIEYLLNLGRSLVKGDLRLTDVFNTEHIADRDEHAMALAASKAPSITWKTIAPLILPFARMKRAVRHRCNLHDWRSPISRFSAQCDELVKICEECLGSAATSIAQRRPDVFWKLVEYWDSRPRTIAVERSLVNAMESLPNESADSVLTWLICRSRRFRIGDLGRMATSQEPARRLIEKFSPCAADKTIRFLESAILEYWDPDLKRALRFRHERLMEGHLGPNCHGLAQFTLLSAIPDERLSPKALGQLGVWRRKFGAPRTGVRERPQAMNVVSTLPRRQLHLLRDSDWLRIAAGEWSDSQPPRREIGSGQVGWATHEHFSHDLGEMATRQPTRFARLGLELSVATSRSYLYSILQACSLKDPPEVLTKAGEQQKGNSSQLTQLRKELDAWHPVSGEDIEALFEHIGYPEEPNLAMEFCRIVQHRDDISWSIPTVKMIARLATSHSDPEPTDFRIRTSSGEGGGMVEDVANSSLNCVRGTAALAIKDLLFRDQTVYPRFEGAIKHLMSDPNVSVRAAAVATCVPLLNIDRDKAVKTFCALCDTPDDRVFESHYLNGFLRYALWTGFDRLRAILDRMARSEIPEVTKQGAAWIAAAWMHEGWCAELLTSLVHGSIPQRHGVAEVLGGSEWDESTVTRRVVHLPVLFNDDDQGVRRDAARLFWDREPWTSAAVRNLALDYFVDSQAFATDPTGLLHGLGQIPSELIECAPIVLAAADKFAGPLADSARSLGSGIASDVPELFKLLLRIYQQAQDARDDRLQGQCLDRWDALLQAGVVGFRESEDILDSFEQ